MRATDDALCAIERFAMGLYHMPQRLADATPLHPWAVADALMDLMPEPEQPLADWERNLLDEYEKAKRLRAVPNAEAGHD